MSGSEALATALRLLAGRERSERDLADRLRRRGFAEAAIAAALARCREFGYLDDRRFALLRAAELMQSGRAVGPKALAELVRRGVEEDLARAALAETGAEVDPETVLLALLDRRFPAFCWAEAADRERRRVVDFFRRRGFSPPLILELLQKRGR